jgi:hypothetical protein
MPGLAVGRCELRKFTDLRAAHLGAGKSWQAEGQGVESTGLVSYVAFSLQKDEIIGGKAPSGYPGGTLGWFCQCFRVVTHYCHAITLTTQDQRGCSILLKKAQSTLMPNCCRVCPQTLSKAEQFWPDTKSLDIVTWVH